MSDGTPSSSPRYMGGQAVVEGVMMRGERTWAIAVRTPEGGCCRLALTDEDLASSDYDTDFKMNPPLRSAEDVRAVREGLADGTLDAIATDHAPHAVEDKRVEFDAAANGILGLETAFPVVLELVRQGRLGERRMVEALTSGPAMAFGLPGGTLAPGAPADVAVLDPALRWEVDPMRLASRSRNTPWKGRTLTGRATHVLVGGRLVHELGGRG